MNIERQLEITTKIALELLNHLEELGEVYAPVPDRPAWRWETTGEPIADEDECPPLLLKL